MKTHTLKFAMLSVILLVLAGTFVSCKDKENHPTKWVWTIEDSLVVTLEFYPAEDKYYTCVDGEISDESGYQRILFQDDTWKYYKIVGNMMYIRGENEEFPNENALYNKWLILQHTDQFLEIKYAGYLPAIPIITHYLFKAEN